MQDVHAFYQERGFLTEPQRRFAMGMLADFYDRQARYEKGERAVELLPIHARSVINHILRKGSGPADVSRSDFQAFMAQALDEQGRFTPDVIASLHAAWEDFHAGRGKRSLSLSRRFFTRERLEAALAEVEAVARIELARGREERGYGNLPNAEYRRIIEAAFEAGTVLSAQWDATLTPAVRDEDKVLLAEHGITLVFIPGLDDALAARARALNRVHPPHGAGAHYGLSRNQIYLDARYLTERLTKTLSEEFSEEVHHELTERQAVLDGLTEPEREQVNRTRPENRPDSLTETITALATRAHVALMLEEGRLTEGMLVKIRWWAPLEGW